MPYIMALDQGTTSSRCIIFDVFGSVVSCAQKEFPQIYPTPGWVEHSPYDILNSQLEVCRAALKNKGLGADDIACVGITNQRETTIVWDRKTGKPVYNAIVWQCRRTSELCEEMKSSGYESVIKNKTGLVADAYFSGTKIKWILDNVPGARSRAESGELAFGTVDSWLIWNLTGGKRHVTDVTNASRTMLFNIHEMRWDTDILRELDIPEAILPEVLPSASDFGTVIPSVFGGEIRITGVAGDQQASLFGQGCHNVGEVKNTYGTGCFMLMNTGNTPVRTAGGLLTTVAWQLGNEVTYALEGSVFIAGAAIKWLRDGLGMIKTAAETEEMARSVPDTAGVMFVPAFTGLGAPYWDPDARGIICGLTRGVTRAHIVRAALEAMAYQTDDVLGAMQSESGYSISALRADGGASANNFTMQFQADISGVRVERPINTESTALGAASLAALGVGLETLKSPIARAFEPRLSFADRAALKKGWREAVERCR